MMWLKCAVVSAAMITTLSAQTWEVSPFAGYLRLLKKPLGSLNTSSPKDDDTKLTARQPGYGVSVTMNTHGYYGVEVGILRSRARIDSNIVPASGGDAVLETATVTQNQVFLNGICYFMPRGEWFRPYVTAGVDVQFWSTPGVPDWAGGSSKNIGFNYGGGVKLRIFKPVYFRLDVRDILAGSPYGLQYANDASGSPRSPGLYRQLQGTVGLSITF
jgi:opacity protein-like surface antigen